MDTKNIDKLRSITDITKRRLYLLGLVSQSLGEIKPVLVGGCALEFYSLGGYATGDIDVVYPNNSELNAPLFNLGFNKQGRFWVNDELQLIFEAPGSQLTIEEEKRITKINVDGLDVSILSVEDLIRDRLNAAVHWQSSDDALWAKELLKLYQGELDQQYLKDCTATDNTEGTLQNILKEIENDD